MTVLFKKALLRRMAFRPDSEKNVSLRKTRFIFPLLLLLLLPFSGCYLFIGDIQGFTINGVYDGGTTSSIGLCSNTDLNNWLTYYAGDSADTQDNSGCLRFSVSGTCFPSTASTGFARFDFVSPAITQWAPAPSGYSFEGFRFSLKTNLPGLYAQGILKVTTSGGSTTFYASSFFALTANTSWQQYTSGIPAGATGFTVEEAYVRIFVPNSTISLYAGPEAIVMLDQVIPVLVQNTP